MLRSWREVRDARRKGRRDGRAGVPNPKDDAIPFELREILARADARVEELMQRWRREDAELVAELAEAERDAAEAAARLADAQSRRDAARADHDRRTAEEDERVSRLQAQLEALAAAGGPGVGFGLEETALEEASGEPSDGALPDDVELDHLAPSPPDPAPDPDDADPHPGLAESGPVDAVPDPAQTSDPTPALGSVVPHPAVRRASEAPSLEAKDEAWAAAWGPVEEGWHGIGPVLYWVVVLAILVGEFPLNAVAFRLFREPDLFTYVMTASLAIAIVAIAHFVGSVLAGRSTSRAARWIVAGFAVVLTVAIGVISVIRYDYLRRVAGGAVGPVVGALAFACINLVVFAAAAGWSYLRHDPRTLVNRRAAARRAEREADRLERRQMERERRAEEEARRREEERRRREEERRRRELEAERERRRRELELVADRHRAELEARRNAAAIRREELRETIEAIRAETRDRLAELARLERAVEEARAAHAGFEARVRDLRHRREALRDETRARVGLIRAHRDRLVAAYCAANVRARKDRASPRCFERIPPLAVPADLSAPTVHG